MKFFLPGCENDLVEIEEIYKSIKDFAASNLGWEISDRRVHSLAYIDTTGKRDNYDAEVGKISNDNGELVYAILETELTFLICTMTNGVSAGYPMIVNKKEIIGKAYFD